MNDRFEFPSSIEPELFDRLVDGELSAAEERTLLGELDARPGGWRHCALAFLEARAWRQELTNMVRPRSAGLNGTPVTLFESPRKDTSIAAAVRPRFAQTVSIAAAVLVAFFLGVVVRAYWPPQSSGQEGVIVQGSDHEIGSSTLATGADSSDANRTSDPRDADFELPTVTMSLVSNDGQPDREIKVPLVETDQLDLRWLESRPEAVPQSLVEALRKQGHQVDQRRLYVPVVLDDGRRAIVPLDQAEVKLTGTRF